MKRNKILLAVFFVISVFIQILYFENRKQLYEFGFAVGIEENIKSGLDITVMYLLVPIIFIIFMISDSIHNLTHGYGKLLIIRHYSKTKLFLENRLKNALTVVGITAFQTIVYIPFNNTMLSLKGGLVQVLLMYFLVLNLIVMMQGVLELFIAPHIANIVLFIYSYISCYFIQMFSLNSFFRILLFPSLLFGTLNSSVVFNNTYFIYLSSTIAISIILIFIGIYKFKKTDIF